MVELIKIRSQSFEVCECGNCGVTYVVAEIVRNRHRESGGYSFCPNGHQWGWSKEVSEETRTRQERDRLKQQLAQKDDEIRYSVARREEAEREAAAARKKLVKLKARAAAGVCPCCNRTFSELQKHIATKHPTFRAEDVSRENIVSIVKARA